MHTFNEIENSMRSTSSQSANAFRKGSNLPGAHLAPAANIDNVVEILTQRRAAKEYAFQMREALTKSIASRYGRIPAINSSGLRMPKGGPFLAQDVIGKTTEELMESPGKMRNAEKKRKE